MLNGISGAKSGYIQCLCYYECPQLANVDNYLVNVNIHILNW